MLTCVVVGFAGCGPKKTELVFLNWGEFLDPELEAIFEEENPDIDLKQKYVTSNEEMYTLCTTEGTEIDMLVPSDYLVQQLMSLGLLAKIDTSALENYKYVERTAESRSFDSNAEYSIPYMMGTVGIVYNKTMVTEPVTSWSILFDEKYQKQVIMYDSQRDSMMVAFMLLGYDLNTTDPDEINEAADLLIEQKNSGVVLGYGTDDIKTSMISGSAALAVDYSGAAVAAIMENPDLDYVVPEEGSNIWVDNLVILESSEHKEAAMRFIDFLCRPDIAARNAEYIGYTTPNDGALELLSDELLSNPAYVISDDVAARCDYYVDLGEDIKLYVDAWMKVKTSF